MTAAPEQPPPAAESVHAADLITSPPEPAANLPETPPAAPAPAPGPQPAAPTLPPRVDSAGVAFDATRHLEKQNPHSGRWMPKRPRRPEPHRSRLGRAGTGARSFVSPDVGDNGDVPVDAVPRVDLPPAPDQYKLAAVSACSILYAVGMTMGGEEWRPSDDEHGNLVLAFENYFRAKGITDIPPGWALTIAVLAYAGPRFRQPKTVATLEKIRGAFARVGLWWRSRRIARSIPAG